MAHKRRAWRESQREGTEAAVCLNVGQTSFCIDRHTSDVALGLVIQISLEYFNIHRPVYDTPSFPVAPPSGQSFHSSGALESV